MILQALTLTLRLAVTVSFILLIVGVPLAYWLANSRRRWKFFVEALVSLPIVLPPTVLGFYVLVAIGPLSPVGRWYQAIAGHPLAFTFEGLVVGSVLYSLPFAVQPMATSFASIDHKLLDASALLGASRWRTFRRIVLPLGLPGVLTGFVLSFAHTLGEFGVVLMIGGNIPGATRTISILIFDQVEALDYAAANRTALLLLVLCFAILAGLYDSVWRVRGREDDAAGLHRGVAEAGSGEDRGRGTGAVQFGRRVKSAAEPAIGWISAANAGVVPAHDGCAECAVRVGRTPRIGPPVTLRRDSGVVSNLGAGWAASGRDFGRRTPAGGVGTNAGHAPSRVVAG